MDNQVSLAGGRTVPAGDVKMTRERQLGELGKGVIVPASLGWRVKNWLQHGHRSTRQNVGVKLAGLITGVIPAHSALALRKFTPDLRSMDIVQWQQLQALLLRNANVHELAAHFGGKVLDFGVVGTRVVTTAGVGFIVDAFQNLTELENMKYHGFGTGGTAEASGDTALVTELTTQYNPDSTRPTGSTTEGASANIYRTVGTFTPDAGGTIAVTEHGVFSQAATGGGVLLDRTLFSVVNVTANQDSLQATYELTLPAGS